jgi:tRNA (cmo5U34)-methyltransferase
MPRQLWKLPSIVLRERRSTPGRNRIPEPMVMNDPESVAQFHAGGVTNPVQPAVYDLSARALHALLPENARLLDLGVGSGRALARLAQCRPDIQATGVDLAPNMLATAQELFRAEGCDKRIHLVEADITKLPSSLTDQPWDAISCVWTLHQLPDFDVLRGALRQIAAERERTGAAVWILDFNRQRGPSTFSDMVDVMAPALPPVLRADALASEAAGFTHGEMDAELRAAGLTDLHSGHSRPLAWLQAFWTPQRDGKPRSNPQFTAVPLPANARRDGALLRAGFTAKPF